MEKPIKPGRVTALACILMLLVIVFVVALYKLQIVDGKAYYEENRNSVASSQTVEAARGRSGRGCCRARTFKTSSLAAMAA